MFDTFEKICTTRRSVRGYLDKPVDEEIIQSIFSVAQSTPSSCNTQPWKAKVVSGERCNELREAFVKTMDAGAYAPDFDHSMSYHGVYKDRQKDAAVRLYQAMNIERDDKAGRHQSFLRNFEFFGAPHVAFIGMEEGFGLREAVDMGMYTQTLMLAMTAHGLGSCPQNTLSFNGPFLREFLGLEDNWRVITGISFGYEDTTDPANNSRTDRAALLDSVEFFS